jgi:hypothetical protein
MRRTALILVVVATVCLVVREVAAHPAREGRPPAGDDGRSPPPPKNEGGGAEKPKPGKATLPDAKGAQGSPTGAEAASKARAPDDALRENIAEAMMAARARGEAALLDRVRDRTITAARASSNHVAGAGSTLPAPPPPPPPPAPPAERPPETAPAGDLP